MQQAIALFRLSKSSDKYSTKEILLYIFLFFSNNFLLTSILNKTVYMVVPIMIGATANSKKINIKK